MRSLWARSLAAPHIGTHDETRQVSSLRHCETMLSPDLYLTTFLPNVGPLSETSMED